MQVTVVGKVTLDPKAAGRPFGQELKPNLRTMFSSEQSLGPVMLNQQGDQQCPMEWRENGCQLWMSVGCITYALTAGNTPRKGEGSFLPSQEATLGRGRGKGGNSEKYCCKLEASLLNVK
jgi:hypothetical protein